ncbi:hypothetical protein MG293_012974 [Ovis ammon polii]|uniref:Kazrin-like n=2 Tax=Ovis TaxID=9935 RepID=A0A836A5H0_SHEEP|nr:hypothetical protein JEQ12_003866 [Ovis aries]KAI4536771.1 hypothetical protein MG293_012974 [Ovis ammon polii]KAI4563246.1 hypothetical protein MJT46_010855 [Ovis ammon polii x Ovis aries]
MVLSANSSVEHTVQSLHTLNDQISHFIVTKSKALEEDQDPFLPTEKETLKSSMILMRHLLMDAQSCDWLHSHERDPVGSSGECLVLTLHKLRHQMDV